MSQSVQDLPLTRVFVLLGYGQGLQHELNGKLPNDSVWRGSYGYGYAEPWVDVAFSTDHKEPKIVGSLRRAFKEIVGFDLWHAYRNRAGIDRADVVWTHTEKEHLAISALKILSVIRSQTPVVAQSIWLWDWLPNAAGLRKALTLHLLRMSDVHTSHSQQNASVGSRTLGRPVVVVPYGCGIATSPPRPPANKRPLVIVPGNDRDRDWELLRAVARKRPNVDFRVLSRRWRARVLSIERNIQVSEAGADEMIEFYSRCDAVAIPLSANTHASGATTLLKALGFRRPAVVTNVGGIDLYGGPHVFYAPEGSVEGFLSALDRALAATQQAAFLEAGRQALFERGLTEPDYALRHVMITLDLFAKSPMRPLVSALQSLVALQIQDQTSADVGLLSYASATSLPTDMGRSESSRSTGS